MTSNNDIVELVGKLIDSNETDPEKLSYSILLEVSKEYTSAREEKFANEEFISAMIHLKDYSDSFKLTRNCILSIGLTCKMYHYHPNKAFNFLWSFRNNKKYIVFVSRGIWVFPQF